MNYGKPKRPRRGRSDTAQFYLNAHPACEACNIIEAQEVHHILTRATGGPDENWNFLALCRADHMIFHQLGRRAFAQRFPALAQKIEEACKTGGRKF